MTTFLIRYAEVALKGDNRAVFEKQLMASIQRALGLPRKAVVREKGQILAYVPDQQTETAREALQRVYGVAWFAPAQRCGPALEDMCRAAERAAAPLLDENTSFAVRAERAVKSLPYTSEDMGREIGSALAKASGAPVDLDTPDVEVYATARGGHGFVCVDRVEGPGGLPVGSTAKALSLVSGGFDSIASSALLAKRGAQVDLLHFHVYPGRAGVLNSKLPDLWERLSDWTLTQRVFLASYGPFELAMATLDADHSGYELVLFRRLMARVAAQLANTHDYQTLVLGDSLGQVASQTIENIIAMDSVITLPVLRPLVGMDKVEIVDFVTEMGLAEIATADYKDCCSIIARHPATRPHPQAVTELERSIDIDAIAGQIASNIEVISLGAADGLPEPRSQFEAFHVEPWLPDDPDD